MHEKTHPLPLELPPQLLPLKRPKRLLGPIDGQAMIGLCISGNRDNLKERDRHITLETLIPALPSDKRYILIQKDLHEGDRAWLEENSERVLFVGDHLTGLHGYGRHILTHMAYIVTIDSALGHLAGTMNIPTGSVAALSCCLALAKSK